MRFHGDTIDPNEPRGDRAAAGVQTGGAAAPGTRR